MSGWLIVAAVGAAIWLIILVLPWQPWRVRERLEPACAQPDAALNTLTVLIPARDEAATIGGTLKALGAQGQGLHVVVVDDQSSDGTLDIARESAPATITLTALTGAPLPEGWAGKLWALEQARQHATTPLVMLLDADITLSPGMIPALLAHKSRLGAGFVSIMAALRMTSPAERLLMPAFVYFFKLLYPFALSNSGNRLIAAGAGGCILMDRALLEGMGGFGALKGAIIDDCALARAAKRQGARTWIGLSHGVKSMRAYDDIGTIWHMVARTAFTQLHYSWLLLMLCTALLLAAAWCAPAALIGAPTLEARLLGAAGLLAMGASYMPTLRYYGLSPLWALAMPLIASLYLAMTWSSALRYWRGARSEWKGRVYARHG